MVFPKFLPHCGSQQSREISQIGTFLRSRALCPTSGTPKPSKPLVLKTYQAYIQETIGLQGMEMSFKGLGGSWGVVGGQNHVPWDPAWELQFEKHLDHK